MMNNRLEVLLKEKSFAQLSAEEKFFVTEYIGEEEYGRIHLLLKNGKAVLQNTPPPSPAIKANLLAAMRQTHGLEKGQKPGAIIRLLRYRVPAWQVAAAVALLFGLHFWLQEEPQLIEKTETVYLHSTDTIYKEVAMPAPATEKNIARQAARINVKPKTQRQQVEAGPILFASADSSARRFVSTELPDTFSLDLGRPRGQSAAQTADLWDLLEEVY